MIVHLLRLIDRGVLTSWVAHLSVNQVMYIDIMGCSPGLLWTLLLPPLPLLPLATSHPGFSHCLVVFWRLPTGS